MTPTTTDPTPPTRRPLIAAGLLLGVGLGAFVDGIVLHQILQVHNMLSAGYPTRGLDAETLVRNLEVNMVWDGLFHAFAWLTTAAGLAALWRCGRRADVPWAGRTLVGAMLAGWGLFNLVEGVIDHHVLQVHHVVERPDHLIFDLAFLGFGALLVLAGVLLIRGDRSAAEPQGSRRSATVP